LLWGPPGGGKTVTAKKLAEELGYRFISPSYGDLSNNGTNQGLSYGEMAQRLNAVFEDARRQGPTVLFLDELSALARVRQGAYTGNDASVTTDTLLQELNK